MARVKVRRRPPPLPHEDPFLYEWGNKSEVLPHATPTPQCKYPGCTRRALRLPLQPRLHATHYRVAHWCVWHRPNALGKRPVDLEVIPRPHRLPDAPLCLIPNCPRVQEVRYRPWNRDTNTFEAPIRYPTCLVHRRAFGRRWYTEVPNDIYQEWKTELAARHAQVKAHRKAWKEEAHQAWLDRQADQDEYYRRVGLGHLTGKGREFTPKTFWDALLPIDKQEVLKRHHMARAYGAAQTQLAYLLTKWDGYAKPQINARTGAEMPPLAMYAPTLDQWTRVFEWLDTQTNLDPMAEDTPAKKGTR